MKTLKHSLTAFLSHYPSTHLPSRLASQPITVFLIQDKHQTPLLLVVIVGEEISVAHINLSEDRFPYEAI